MQKTISNYGGLKQTDLLAKGLEVYKGINGNANFPSLQDQMKDFETLLGKYQVAITAADSRDRVAVAQRNAYRQIVLVALSDFSATVNTVARGNDVLMAETGLTLSKQPEPSKISMPQIIGIDATNIPGCMQVRVKKESGAKSYIFQAATTANAAESEWQSVTASVTKCAITGLQQGQKYWFRVIAVSSKGVQVCGQTIARYVPQFVMDAA